MHAALASHDDAISMRGHVVIRHEEERCGNVTEGSAPSYANICVVEPARYCINPLSLSSSSITDYHAEHGHGRYARFLSTHARCIAPIGLTESPVSRFRPQNHSNGPQC